METITVNVKLFAIYQEVYKKSELSLAFPEGTPVRSVLDFLLQDHPELERWREVTRFGVNLQFVEGDQKLQNGDEVVLIPPVSGG
jgi:sulfur-carrier protein